MIVVIVVIAIVVMVFVGLYILFRKSYTGTWKSGLWSRCVNWKTSGDAFQTRDVICNTGREKDCDPKTKPEIERPCISDADWIVGNWSECSAKCGEGKQTRDVHCEFDFGTDHGMIKTCVKEKPTTEQTCKIRDCSSNENAWFNYLKFSKAKITIVDGLIKGIGETNIKFDGNIMTNLAFETIGTDPTDGTQITRTLPEGAIYIIHDPVVDKIFIRVRSGELFEANQVTGTSMSFKSPSTERIFEMDIQFL